MRILVLGGGLQGSACAYDLLRQDDVETVTVADAAAGERASFLPDDPRLAFVRLDFGDEASVREAMEGHEVVLSAAPYYFNDDLARLAVEAGCDYSDLGGNTDIVFDQLELAARARDAGCTVIPDVGLAPGMADVLAAEGIRRLDEAESVKMLVGGLPQHPRPPLNYQVVYSLEGTLDYYTTPSWIVRDGKRRQIEALSEVEEVEFAGLGTLEAFHTGGGASILPWRYEGKVDRLEYKTLRYPGHAAVMEAIRELGLLDRQPVEVDHCEVVPRDLFIACASRNLTHPDEPDLVALRVVAEGRRDGRPARVVWELLDREDEETGITAMMRCTGYTLSVVGLLMGRDVLDEPGVRTPDEALPVDRYLDELGRRGVRVRLTEEEPG
jgi:lysine 6-dehydrogenase